MTATTEKNENGRKKEAQLMVPEHLKEPRKVYVPTGNPRGRKPGQKNKKTLKADKQRLICSAAWQKAKPIQAQSSNIPVQTVSPEASVKREPMLDLSNMAEIFELDLATCSVTDLGEIYRNSIETELTV